jgi:hypothetical protein
VANEKTGRFRSISDKIIHKKSAEGLTMIGKPSAPDLLYIILLQPSL